MTNEPTSDDLTLLLQQWSSGDSAALDRLMPLIYSELKSLAGRALSGERSNHTLQTTALVNEAYLRIAGQKRTEWVNREHFVAIAAQAMRRVLVDHARRRQATKRPTSSESISIDEIDLPGAENVDIVMLDFALEQLAKIKPRQAQVVELRFFGGLSLEETAATLDVTSSTITRDWRMAQAWLKRALEESSKN
jgi:RNA polymerase sigma-70 factor (ECF subfamily)